MTRTWMLGVQRDQYTVTLNEVPRWVFAVGRLAPCFHWVDRLHVFGWLWHVPLGRPQRDDAGWLRNSVMGRLYDVETAFLDWYFKRWRDVAVIPVSVDVARAIDGDFVSIFDDEDDE